MRLPDSRSPKAQRNQSGQGLVEYALILVLIALVVILILATLGGTLQNVFSNIAAGV